MKKLHVFLAFLLMTTTVFANLQRAERFLRNDRLDRAVPAIIEAMAQPENQANANAWHMQARIFTTVAASPDPEVRNLEPNAINLAFESFQKAFELDQLGILMNLSHMDIGRLAAVAYNEGVSYFSQNNFAEAADAFILSAEVSALIDVIDTNAIFNAALCANSAENTELAKTLFQRVVDLRADIPAAYTSLAVLFKDKGDSINAAKYADLAAELFPYDYGAMINSASIHLMLGNSLRASEILSAMSEMFYDQAVVFFAKGVAFDQIEMYEEAEQAYLRAIELQPDFFDAIFNLAAHYVTRGVTIRAEADLLPLTEQRKYDEMIELANTMFRNAIPMLEKANEMQPNNIPVMSTLRDIYVHLRMMDRATEITAEIEALQGQ